MMLINSLDLPPGIGKLDTKKRREIALKHTFGTFITVKIYLPISGVFLACTVTRGIPKSVLEEEEALQHIQTRGLKPPPEMKAPFL